jgi:predicted Zn-ribbon and HTH transcriptional regulator
MHVLAVRKIFDGSDDGRKVYDTLAVIGRKAYKDDTEARLGPAGARARTNRTNGNPMALIACPKCHSEDINGTPQADSRLLIHCNQCGSVWLRCEARRDPGRPVH